MTKQHDEATVDYACYDAVALLERKWTEHLLRMLSHRRSWSYRDNCYYYVEVSFSLKKLSISWVITRHNRSPLMPWAVRDKWHSSPDKSHPCGKCLGVSSLCIHCTGKSSCMLTETRKTKPIVLRAGVAISYFVFGQHCTICKWKHQSLPPEKKGKTPWRRVHTFTPGRIGHVLA